MRQGIMSAYAMGLLMNRKLIIKLKKPCPLENYLIPNEILNKINIMKTNQNVIYKYKYVLIGKKLIWVNEN